MTIFDNIPDDSEPDDDFLKQIGPFDLSKFPPGLVGKIADFIYQAAPYPVLEIAIAAAFGLMAGICGRAFNINKAGLNLYLLLVASTGSGKEAMKSGIMRLFFRIGRDIQRANTVPAIMEFCGPDYFSSEPAIIRHLSEVSPCCLSVQSEFGHLMKRMRSPKASSTDIGLQKAYCDIFSKSGKGNMITGMAYADKKNNTKAVHSPTLTLLAESNPVTFYEAINEGAVTNGLLPRFLIIEYKGPRVDYNEAHVTVEPSDELIKELSALAVYSLEKTHKNEVNDVQMSEDAKSLLRAFGCFCTKQLNLTNSEDIKQLWNRAHLNASKVAALLAIGVNIYTPTIVLDHARWAIRLVVHCVGCLIKRFDDGVIGQSVYDRQRERAILEAIYTFSFTEYGKMRTYGVTKLMHENGFVPQSYLSQKLRKTAPFQNDTRFRTPTEALKATLQSLCDQGYIRKPHRTEVVEKTAFNGEVYELMPHGFTYLSNFDDKMTNWDDTFQRRRVAEIKRETEEAKQRKAYAPPPDTELS